MTYEQALALLRQRYGATPWTQASGSEVQSFLRSQGVPSTYITQIGTAYYTAQRTNSSIDNVLQTKGLYTPTTTASTTTTAPATTATPVAVPTISVPSLSTAPTATPTTTPSVVTAPAVPTLVAPSALAAQESGAIGAASIASQMGALPTVTPLPPVLSGGSVVTRTDREVIQNGARYNVMSDGSLWYAADQSNIPATTTPTVVDEQTKYRESIGLPAITTTSPVTAAPVSTTPSITVPTLQNPLAAETPTTAVPTLTNPLAAIETKPATTAAAMGGSLEDQINYTSAIRRLTAQLEKARTGTGQQAGETRAQYETQIRKAGRDMYNAQTKALASLAARGITGAPGLSVAARRAGQEEPAYRRSNLILDRDRQLSALQRTLSQQQADYEEELRRNQEQLTRATTISNQLTGTGA